MNDGISRMWKGNVWLWFHILAGGFLSKLLVKFGIVPQLSVDLVLALAIIWEIIEYKTSNIVKIYGSKKAFYLDSLGDIIGAVLAAIIAVW